MKNLSLLLLLSIISLNVHSQKKYDIGIISGVTGGPYYGYSTNLKNLNNFNLEFRNQLNDKWRLNFGISYGVYAPQQNGIFLGYNSILYSITDTSITYRLSDHRQLMVAMRFGVERVFNKQFLKNPIFKTRVFSYGFDVLLGRTKYVLNKYNHTSCYDSLYLPLPSNYNSSNYNYSISSNSDRYESNILNGAFQFSLKANFPINERLTFSITSLSSLDFTLKLNENYDTSTYRQTNFQTANLASLITIGPNSPLLDIEPLNDFDFDISSRIFIGIRYRFGKKKSEVEVIEKG